MILFQIVFFLLFLVFLWHFLTRKYLNPYKLIFIFGKKGSGKSTLLAKYSVRYRAMGWNVFSTESIVGTQQIDYKDIGHKTFPPESLIIIDEVGMIWDNRGFKNFDSSVRDFFKLQRHDHLAIVMASQTFDVDKKIRDLCDEMYLVKPFLRVWTYGRRILRVPCLVEASGDGPSRIDENLRFDSLLMFWAGSVFFTFIPHWTQYFDSFAKRDWGPPVDSGYVRVPEQLYRRERWHKKYRRKRFSFRLVFQRVLLTCPQLGVIIVLIKTKLKRGGTSDGGIGLHTQVNKIKK